MCCFVFHMRYKAPIICTDIFMRTMSPYKGKWICNSISWCWNWWSIGHNHNHTFHFGKWAVVGSLWLWKRLWACSTLNVYYWKITYWFKEERFLICWFSDLYYPKLQLDYNAARTKKSKFVTPFLMRICWNWWSTRHNNLYFSIWKVSHDRIALAINTTLSIQYTLKVLIGRYRIDWKKEKDFWSVDFSELNYQNLQLDYNACDFLSFSHQQPSRSAFQIT